VSPNTLEYLEDGASRLTGMFFTTGFLIVSGLLSLALGTSAILDFPVIVNSTSPLTLAIQPACGTLNSSTFTEINTGITLSATRCLNRSSLWPAALRLCFPEQLSHSVTHGPRMVVREPGIIHTYNG
jgi:hypothetical protein